MNLGNPQVQKIHGQSFNNLNADLNKLYSKLRCQNPSKLVIVTNRKTGFTGFLIDILCVRSLYSMISNFDMEYLLMHKVSRDHLKRFLVKFVLIQVGTTIQ